MKGFDAKQDKWNALQGMIENGAARKVIVIKDLEPAAGYVMAAQENGSGSRTTSPVVEESPDYPDNPDDVPNPPSTTSGNGHPSVKSDLMATLEQKDRK
ncbi:MAG: hypothetical protein LBV74_16535, partial [Tannerella sp.]|nr:hypothetical protein [Tannerella sp.]